MAAVCFSNRRLGTAVPMPRPAQGSHTELFVATSGECEHVSPDERNK